MNNVLYCGDNLKHLKTLETDSVDLVYIDPPFFSNKQYATIWGDGAEIRQFDDRWIKGESGKYSKDINKYLNWMEPRIKEIYRVLKPTGSFYLHCDDSAVHYLKMLCDDIFGMNRFVNQIQWKRSNAKVSSTKYVDATDYILLYSKNDTYTYNPQYTPLPESIIQSNYTGIEEETGRRYRVAPLENRGDKISELNFPDRGTVKARDTFGFKWTQATLDERLAKNPHLIYWSKNGIANYKVYLDDHKGQSMTNIWTDINNVSSNSSERIGYPTQKPEALLERIIKTSSNEEDIVLDCFGGGGTTMAVAQRLNRQFIGMEVSPTACRLQAERLGLNIQDIIGMPLEVEDIAKLDGWEFQNYVIHLLDAENKKNIKVHERGPDGGIDGRYYEVGIEVKKFKAGRPELDKFHSIMVMKGEKEGIFIALAFSADFRGKVALLKREHGIKVHCFTLEDIIKKKHVATLVDIRSRSGIGKFFEN
ncbi:hypothetical protein LCGC14_0303010 [marine sediment metagenome]|uniref:DNA methylase N-4/N-6 domain-containing protein n=1 Tax=marine sediment metagenome TaxID=412755 RepID=A0A0F9TPP0_9ZZZZ